MLGGCLKKWPNFKGLVKLSPQKKKKKKKVCCIGKMKKLYRKVKKFCFVVIFLFE
jgi:hypothetical protein